MTTKKLRLRAESADDLEVIGGVLQDALIPVSDMAFLAAESQFVFVANRFCWELDGVPDQAAGETPGTGGKPSTHHRINCGVTFDGVQAVKTRGFDREDPATILSLLTIQTEAGVEGPEITLICAGDASVRLTVGKIDCRLDDIGEPWPTVWRPSHGDAEAE